MPSQRFVYPLFYQFVGPAALISIFLLGGQGLAEETLFQSSLHAAADGDRQAAQEVLKLARQLKVPVPFGSILIDCLGLTPTTSKPDGGSLAQLGAFRVHNDGLTRQDQAWIAAALARRQRDEEAERWALNVRQEEELTAHESAIAADALAEVFLTRGDWDKADEFLSQAQRDLACVVYDKDRGGFLASDLEKSAGGIG